MELVLNSFEKCLGDFNIFVIVNTTLLVDIRNFKVEPSFTSSYFPYPIYKFIKVILPKSAAMFKTLIIEHKTFNYKLSNCFGSPNTKLGCLKTVYPIANGYNSI